ncbi:MAG: tRNA glutamyl-Q(34) synthetase GluQRS [Verrucomicrobiota bacterium JB025]|nr:tRNA glutamyl-Q(34) synthetase GluQRS [Verrucomicrobiota bacterium JB025]
MSVRTRFAPSPTGRLHLGHALSARVACEFARKHNGQFLLRHEDIDTSRVRPEFYLSIEHDLHWLGLDWNEPPLRQTDRIAAYDTALESLKAVGLVYPCFCTRREIRDEISRMSAAPHGPEGPLYPGTCRQLSTAERRTRIDRGDPHAWRLDSRKAARLTGSLTFHDLLLGRHSVDPGLLGDVVLARKDIGTAYHLAVVVDDAFQQITHVTRGRDLLVSTHVHRILQQLLRLPEPTYLHHPLVLDDTGKRLAKRHDALAIATLRDAGKPPAEVLALTDDVFAASLAF